MPAIESLDSEASVQVNGSPSSSPFPSLPKFAALVTIFLGAFLLFFIQLLLGKLILPIFGGAPAVWTSCLLVFQFLLLCGYSLAHKLASSFSLRGQGRMVLLLLAASLVLFAVLSIYWPSPVTPGSAWRLGTFSMPVWGIVRFLLAAAGIPFLILSTTSPLLQHWWGKSQQSGSAYRLYALSNIGSFLGLLAYPFLLEPNFSLSKQAWFWTAGYVVYAASFGVCAWRIHNSISTELSVAAGNSSETLAAPIGWQTRALWISLAACASALLMATTNYICQEVAVIPFLWVLPLCIYLLTFVLAFESTRWYRQGYLHLLFGLAAVGVLSLTQPRVVTSYFVQLVAGIVLLFAGCMVCHGEAARLRPDEHHLTQFYLCISAGGAVGGVFVSLLAPHLFPGFWEFPLAILACAVLLFYTARLNAKSWLESGGSAFLWILWGLIAFLAFRELIVLSPGMETLPSWVTWVVAGVFFLFGFVSWIRNRNQTVVRNSVFTGISIAVALIVVLVGIILPQRWLFTHVLARARNFYGVLTVMYVQQGDYRVLTHGITAHGFQFQDPAKQQILTGYYGKNSGVNVLLSNWKNKPVRVGLIGMGAGTLAALGKPGDTFKFYEINPDVIRFAAGPNPYFSFVGASSARVEIVEGDGRISLEKELAENQPQKFDVLVLDAFSSDAIPLHLLTREAFEIYRKHLRGPDSVIAVHITNDTLNLGPVLAGIAREQGWAGTRTSPGWLEGLSAHSDWVLLSANPESVNTPELKQISIPFPGTAKPILWTDDSSNLLNVLK